MARTDTLGNFLTDVADSIREKKGTADLIPTGNFDTEINSIFSGVDINDYFDTKIIGNSYSNSAFLYIRKTPTFDLSNTTSMGNMFNGWKGLEEVNFNDTSNIENFYNAFYGCNSLKGQIALDIRKATNLVQTFSGCNTIEKIILLNSELASFDSLNSTFASCYMLKKLSSINCANVTRFSAALASCNYLTVFGGFVEAGKAFSTTINENYSDYSIDLTSCNKLTHDSSMNVINGLYDIKKAGVKPQQLILGSINIGKLNAEEIAKATTKGWSVR